MAKKASTNKPVGKQSRLTTSQRATRRSAVQASRPASMLDVLDSATVAYRKKNKLSAKAAVTGDGDTFKIGIRIPFLLQYLIGCEVLPLGVVIEANGPPMSCKTMLMFEFGRFFRESNGWLNAIITEGKLSKSLARSVIGWDAAGRRAFRDVTASTMNQMMKELTHSYLFVKQLAEKGNPATGEKAYGYTSPVLLGVDSIMGANAEETSHKIQQDGDFSRSFPVEALILTPYLKELANLISDYPFVLFLINHRKEGEKDESNPYEKVKATKPGGKQLRFQQSYELILHYKSSSSVPDTRPDGGAVVESRLIEIENGKNSAGTDGRSCRVRVAWRYVMTEKARADGASRRIGRQVTVWQWDEGIPWLLTEYKKGRRAADKTVEATRQRREKLDQIIHIRDAPGDRYYSDTLGVPKTAPISALKMGKLIAANDDILNGLRALFGIEDGYVWDAYSGKDYRKVRDSLQKFASEAGAMQLDKQVSKLTYEEVEELVSGSDDVIDDSQDDDADARLKSLTAMSDDTVREEVEEQLESGSLRPRRPRRYT